MFMMTEENREDFRKRMWQLAEKYMVLSLDFRFLAENGKPTEEEMADAPWISTWRISVRRDPALIGIANAHPVLGERRLITTSWLVALDRSGGWARTESRIYRLGDHAPAQFSEVLF